MSPAFIRYKSKQFPSFPLPWLAMVELPPDLGPHSALWDKDQEPGLLCKNCLLRQQERRYGLFNAHTHTSACWEGVCTGTPWRTLEGPHGRGAVTRWLLQLPLCSLNPMGLLQRKSSFSCASTHSSIYQHYCQVKKSISTKKKKKREKTTFFIIFQQTPHDGGCLLTLTVPLEAF